MVDLKNIQLIDDSSILDAWMEEFGLACITAADELEIYDALSSGPISIDEMSQKLKLGASALDAICKVLVTYALLTNKDSKISLTKEGACFWVSSSPLYRGKEFYRSRDTISHQRVVETAKEGWSPISDEDKSFTEMWEKGELSKEAAQNFTGVMHSLILAPSLSVARSKVFRGRKHIVDVGGGSGAFCAAVTACNNDVRATLMDLPQVCEVAPQYIKKYGQEAAVKLYPANFFQDEWPQDADAFYFSNILHDWPVDRCRTLLRHAFSALPVGGQICINECLLDEGKTSPKMTVIFNLLMYMNHKAQQFTLAELQSLLVEAGFEQPEVKHRFSYYSWIVATKISAE